MKRISIITICKGRLFFLKKTLYSICNQWYDNSKYEVIIVDYGCPDNTYDVCRQFLDVYNPEVNVKLIKVKDDTEYWNASRARNIGAQNASGDYLFFIDCDIKLPYWSLRRLSSQLDDDTYLLKTGGGGVGSCIFKTDTYHEFGGYDERNIGWGCEDTQFYKRVELKYPDNIKYFPKTWFKVNQHSHDLRLSFVPWNDDGNTDNENLKRGLERNRELLYKDLNKPANPNGYGKGELDVFDYNKVEGNEPPPTFTSGIINKPNTKFVIASLPRSGSTNLAMSLNKHFNIHCGQELLAKWDMSRALDDVKKGCKLNNDEVANIIKRPINIVKYFLNNPSLSEDAVGFKIVANQLLTEEQIQSANMLYEYDMKVIHLKRDNLFDVYLSHVYADQSDIWQKASKQKASQILPIEISKEQIMKTCNNILLGERNLEEYINGFDPDNVLEITFDESLTENGKKNIFKFLDVEVISVENKFNESYWKSYKDLIVNYEEVEFYIKCFLEENGRL